MPPSQFDSLHIDLQVKIYYLYFDGYIYLPICVACHVLSDQNAYSICFSWFTILKKQLYVIDLNIFLHLKKQIEFKSCHSDLLTCWYKPYGIFFPDSFFFLNKLFPYIDDVEKYYLCLLISFIYTHNYMYFLHIAHGFLYIENSKWIKHEAAI